MDGFRTDNQQYFYLVITNLHSESANKHTKRGTYPEHPSKLLPALVSVTLINDNRNCDMQIQPWITNIVVQYGWEQCSFTHHLYPCLIADGLFNEMLTSFKVRLLKKMCFFFCKSFERKVVWKTILLLKTNSTPKEILSTDF